MRRAIVFGGYGVFGSHVCRALANNGVPVTVAGRDRAQAEAFAQALGPHCSARVVDITNAPSCRAALDDHPVAVNCAGPFSHIGTGLLESCLDRGCHYVDIADDRSYIVLVRKHDQKFRERGLAAVYGCSSLPGISGALALAESRVESRESRADSESRVESRESRAEECSGSRLSSFDSQAIAGSRLSTLDSPAILRVRVTLFIGNNNPKGQAAVRSLLAGLGRPIAAPQGTLLGFHDREVVTLPPPFDRRAVFNVDSPDYDLFPALLGTRSVSVKVGFELPFATYSFALLARLGWRYGPGTARLLDWVGRMMGWLGCSGAAVMTELFLTDGTVRRMAIAGASDGQRMAALPCAFVAQTLSEGEVRRTGATTAYEFLGARTLLDRLVEAGFRLHRDS